MIITTQKSNVFKLVASAASAILCIVMLFSGSAMAQEYKKVTRLGTSEAMCKGGVETLGELQEYFANNSSAVRAAVANAGWAGSVDDLMAAVANGDVTERAYPVGTRLAWMIANKKGTYVANRYREWAGSKSMDAFQVNVSTDCQVHHIAIPKLCCNVSLVSVTPDSSAACTTPVAAAPPAPAPVAKKVAGFIPFLGIFGGTETRPRYEPAWDMDMRDSSGIYGLRAGLMKGISEKTSVFTQLSYYERNGINELNVYPEDNLALDIGLQRRLSKKAFIGGGIGSWNINDSAFKDTSVFGHIGADIGDSNFQWLLEGRVFDSDSKHLDSLSDNKMFSLGVRYLVK